MELLYVRATVFDYHWGCLSLGLFLAMKVHWVILSQCFSLSPNDFTGWLLMGKNWRMEHCVCHLEHPEKKAEYKSN